MSGNFPIYECRCLFQKSCQAPSFIFKCYFCQNKSQHNLKAMHKGRIPVAPKKPGELMIHGHTRVDPYFWMNERDHPDVIRYLEDENAYLAEVMSDTEDLQEKLYREIRSKIKEEDISVPYFFNGYYYYTRSLEGSEYFLSCRKRSSLEEPEEIMLDVNRMAEHHAYFDLGGSSVSPDNKLLAYGIDTVSRRNYTIYFKNLQTGALLTDEIPMTTGSVVWGNDNQTIFYVERNPNTLRSEKIKRHLLGTPAEQDTVVFYEEDETFSVFIYKTKSQKYLVIGSESTLTSEYQILDADHPQGEFTLFQARKRELEYSVEHCGAYFYIRTNLDALNFRIVRTPVHHTSVENWVEFIPHREEIYISGFSVFHDFLAVSERKDGLNQLHIMSWDRHNEHYIGFDEEVFAVHLSVNKDFHADKVRFSYSSLTTPTSVFDYQVETRERTLLKRQEIPGGFDPAMYETKREFALAEDGTKIPISLVYRKNLIKDGKAPAILYGYGAYGITVDPVFRISILPLLDRGFVFAIAHIRGEQFYGRKWYEDGKLLCKMNTFTDFIACAGHLIQSGYTSAESLFAKGGSAGGLLVGAVANMRPDLFKAIIAQVPFVDVVTTMLDESIPLTTGEFDEWGNPKDEQFYRYMLSYSPYDNVTSREYPAMLVTSGYHDSQVQYWEPAKWVARLRELKTDHNLLLFHTQMDYGHGGASGRFQWIRELALEYAFILKQLGQENQEN